MTRRKSFSASSQADRLHGFFALPEEGRRVIGAALAVCPVADLASGSEKRQQASPAPCKTQISNSRDPLEFINRLQPSCVQLPTQNRSESTANAENSTSGSGLPHESAFSKSFA